MGTELLSRVLDFAAANALLVLSFGVKAALLLLSAGAIVWLLRRASAAARHTVWAIAVASVLVLPVATMTTPWRFAVWPDALSPAALQVNATSAQPDATLASLLEAAFATAPSPPVDAPAAAAVQTVSPSTRNIAAAAFLLWWIVAAAVLLRFIISVVVLRVYCARAEVMRDAAWLALRDRITRRIGVTRHVSLLRASWSAMPMTTGIINPVVLLPAGADAWDAERREVVLTHELAHIARRDMLVQAMAQVACALYWFNPLVWWAAARVRAESERACDDRVLTTGTRASTYAAQLLGMVRSAGGARLAAGTALPMAQRSGFEGRLLAILAQGVERGGVRPRHAALIVFVLSASVMLLAALSPARAAEPAAEVQLSSEDASAPVTAAVLPTSALALPAPLAARTLAQVDTPPAKKSRNFTVTVGEDSLARIVDRQPLSSALIAIISEESGVALLLFDESIVLQFTDEWMDSVATDLWKEKEREKSGIGGVILKAMLRGGVLALLDHGLEYSLHGIGNVYYEDGELVFENRKGERLFSDSNINGVKLMRSFSRRDAEAFAARANRVRRR